MFGGLKARFELCYVIKWVVTLFSVTIIARLNLTRVILFHPWEKQFTLLAYRFVVEKVRVSSNGNSESMNLRKNQFVAMRILGGSCPQILFLSPYSNLTY